MRYKSASSYYRSIFGEKVYRIALDAGCTCPNRDGTKGFGGCIFCSGSGSGEFAADKDLTIAEQLSQAKKIVEKKCRSGKYIAYFQNFTNTYGDEQILREKYLAALSDPEIVGIAIATRPDAISERMYEILKELSDRTRVWIELGLQTMHEKSALWMNRGYTLPVFEEAVTRLSKISLDLEVVVHVIMDLPCESREEMIETIDYCASLPIAGIKIANLNVLSGTRLADEYRKDPFPLMEMDDYIRFLGGLIEHLRPDITVYRLTGDGAKKSLIAPLWVSDKRKVRNRITELFELYDIMQGREYKAR